MEDSNFCPLPWVQMATDPDGSVRLCCRSEKLKEQDRLYNLGQDSVESIWHSETLSKVRRQFLNNEQPSACRNCFTEEKVGKISKRITELRSWPEVTPNFTVPPTPISYDLRLGSLCNLKCRMCNQESSTAIQSEYEQLNDLDPKLFPRASEKKAWWKDSLLIEKLKMQAETIQRLDFAGGEPTLSKDAIEFLSFLKERGFAKKIQLRMTSNLTYASDQFMALLPFFKSVQLNCSIDGIDQINSYIRYPSDWSDIKSNFKRYAAVPELVFIISSSLQVYNALHYAEIFNYFIPYRKGRIYFSPQVVYEPEYLHVSILPKNIRQLAKEQILKFAETKWVGEKERASFLAIARQFDIEKSVAEVQRLRMKFTKFTRILDQKRGQNVCKVLPHLAPLFEQEDVKKIPELSTI